MTRQEQKEMDELIKLPTINDLRPWAGDPVAGAKALTCRNDDDYKTCLNFLVVIKGFEHELEVLLADKLAPLIANLNKAHKQAVAIRNDAYAPLKEAKAIAEGLTKPYWMAQEQKRIAEERKRQQEADAKAERDRQAALFDAELEGNTEAVKVIASMPAMPERVEVAKTTPTVEGLSTRMIWKFRVVDHNLIPRSYLIPNQKMIDEQVQREKDKTNIPGIEAYQEPSFARR